MEVRPVWVAGFVRKFRSVGRGMLAIICDSWSIGENGVPSSLCEAYAWAKKSGSKCGVLPRLGDGATFRIYANFNWDILRLTRNAQYSSSDGLAEIRALRPARIAEKPDNSCAIWVMGSSCRGAWGRGFFRVLVSLG